VSKFNFIKVAGVIAVLMVVPSVVSAQQIGGTVTDSTGGVLPGVTVEARSPALIEGVRSAVTDGNGNYLIVALETGDYEVTYSLPGFGSVLREGIELSTGFTANIDIQLSVGDIEETITVSGATPVVDIQNVEQRAVMDREVIDSIPTGKSLTSYGLLVPGMTGAESYGTSLSQDSGGLTSQTLQRLSIHGGSQLDQTVNVNGMDVGDAFTQGANMAYFPDTNFEEIAYNYSANSAEVETGGVSINMIPREGANEFSGAFFTTFTRPGLHADNLDQDLIDRGLLSGTKVVNNWTVAPSFGGPIVQDKLWFFATHTSQQADLVAPGAFQAVDPRALVFVPDTSKPTNDESMVREQSINLTYQMTSKDKIKAYWTNSSTDKPFYLQGRTLASIFVSPEAAVNTDIRTNAYQLAWVRPHTNRLLFEAGASHQPVQFTLAPSDLAQTDIPGVLEFSPVSASRNMTGWLSGPTVRESPKVINSYRAAVSYVTGSHNLKVGFTMLQQHIAVGQESDANWLAINTYGGFPIRINYYGSSTSENFGSPTLGIYAQEQWTLDRLTVNAGVRFDYVKAGYPDQIRPTNDWVTEPFFIPANTAVTWKDIQPRLGLAYDLAGDGKTAVKFSASRYGARDSTDWAERLNPALSNRRMIRSWNDGYTGCISGTCIVGDGLPQGDPNNPAPNGELMSANADPSFGIPAITRFYDAEWANGFGNRQSNWEISASVQRELMEGVSLDIGYFRRAQVNLSALDDRNLGPSDFDTATVNIPTDSRLPGGGGGTLSFYDLNPASVGTPDELRTNADNFGGESQTWQGLDFTIDARIENLLLQGGVSTGSLSHDYCEIAANLPETMRAFNAPIPARSAFGDTAPIDYCNRNEAWLTQVKLLGSYTLPYGIQVAGTLQNQPGPERAAEARITTNSLGRALTYFPSGVQLNLIEPGSEYGDRFSQFDIRFTKIFEIGSRGTQFRAMFDIFNVFNANTVTMEQPAYGADWLAPQVIMPGRLAKFAFQLDF
tara:strand:- start:27537 stop:30554 length:3018 start_codon:yes stop_codon:yes gene_type:complete